MTADDNAPAATGASHTNTNTRPAQGSAPAPLGNSSEIRTDERPASCAHPVLWPLCGCAAAARRAKREQIREAIAAAAALSLREYLDSETDQEERRETLRDVRAQALAILGELPRPIEELGRVLGRPPRPARPGPARLFEIRVEDAFGDVGTVSTSGPLSLSEIARWVDERIAGIEGWRLAGVRRVTADDPLPEGPIVGVALS